VIENILTLNAAHEIETSPLDREALEKMLDEAFHSATVKDGEDGFIITFDQDADYDSVNFKWFQSRFDRFVYVDRIITAPHARGRGIARNFYVGLFKAARAAGHVRIVAEINLDPPNPASIAFHAALGFFEIGRGDFPEKGKVVSYQECRL
jgi:uncharacterized protein